jgi:NTP pyrophosphatase (non-canonical NTP hydrolase)
MLVVCELAEAVEALRKDDKENYAEELTDAVIRLFDLTMASGIFLEGEMTAKMAKNRQRELRHGKAF